MSKLEMKDMGLKNFLPNQSRLMKRLFLSLISGVTILTIQGCEGLSGGSQSVCSCRDPWLLEYQLGSLKTDFSEERYSGNFTYGENDNDSGCCAILKEPIIMFSRNNNVVPVKSSENNKYACFSTTASIVFGSFLPPAFTLQFWIDPSDDGLSGIIMEESIDSQKALFLSLTNDKKLSLSLPLSGYSSGRSHLSTENSRTLMVNTWQHIAVTVSENNIAFYINGVLDKQQNFDNTVYNRLETRSSFSSEEKMLCFGSCQLNSGDRSFQGKVDNIEFINRVLSADEILGNYRNTQSNFL